MKKYNERIRHSLLKIIIKLFKLLRKKQQKLFILIIIAMIAAALIETASLGIIALFASAVTNPESLIESSIIIKIKDYLELDFINYTKGLIASLGFAVVFFIILKNIAQAIITYIRNRYAFWVSGFIGEKLYDGIMGLSFIEHLSFNSADLILVIEWRIRVGTLLTAMMQALGDIIMVSSMLIVLLYIEPLASLFIIFITSAFAVIIFYRVRGVLDKNAKKIRNLSESVHRNTSKAFHGIKDVKVYGAETYFIQNYIKDIYRLVRLKSFQKVFSKLPAWILEIIGFSIVAISIYSMYFLINTSPAKITGILSLLAVAAWKILPAVNRILNGNVIMRTTLPFMQKIFDYFSIIEKNKHSITKSTQNEKITFKKQICLKNISFIYNNKNMSVITNLDLIILKGDTIGIIGNSGAGKSTLIDIIIGLLIPSSGTIYIDEKELNDDMRRVWMNSIGYVSQNPYILDGTIAENIAFGYRKKEINREKVIQCCEMALMKGFLEQMPDGIDSEIGEHGVRMSGGQRQRIAIARALYKQPQLMIFDEATSALDFASEQALQQTIYSLSDKITLVIIAHSLNTIKNCKKIVWLKNGNIKMIGDPENVIKEYKKDNSK